MLFNSYEFIIFLPVAILIALWSRIKFGIRGEVFVLSVASLLFYSYSGINFTAVLLFSLVVNYTIADALQRVSGKQQRVLIVLGVTLALLTLAWFKYFNFFVDQINALFGESINNYSIVLPIGISFYTFQQIAYLVDIYRGRRVSRGFVGYVLFVTFFPQLIAGPIVHHAEMMPQFYSSRRITWENLSVGITIFAIGLTKKIYLADRLAEYVRPVFRDAAALHPDARIAWIAAACFTLQIYFDFSGYSDMAIGLGRMFGIRLPFNFASPYKSTSIIDFWRRWHITLSRFLRDYVYISLGGNRGRSFRRYFNIFMTMLIGGFWHGAGWNFLLWGGLHGLEACMAYSSLQTMA